MLRQLGAFLLNCSKKLPDLRSYFVSPANQEKSVLEIEDNEMTLVVDDEFKVIMLFENEQAD
jgi:hypothetical protein